MFVQAVRKILMEISVEECGLLDRLLIVQVKRRDIASEINIFFLLIFKISFKLLTDFNSAA